MSMNTKSTTSPSGAMSSINRSTASVSSSPVTDKARDSVTALSDSRTVDVNSPFHHPVGDHSTPSDSSPPSDALTCSARVTHWKMTVFDVDCPLAQKSIRETFSSISSSQPMLTGSSDEIVAASALTQLSREAFDVDMVHSEEEIDVAKSLLSLRKCEERMALEFGKRTN